MCVCVWLWEGSQEVYTGDQHQVSFSLGWGGHSRFCVCVCENVCVSVWLWEGLQEVTQETSFLRVGRAL